MTFAPFRWSCTARSALGGRYSLWLFHYFWTRPLRFFQFFLCLVRIMPLKPICGRQGHVHGSGWFFCWGWRCLLQPRRRGWGPRSWNSFVSVDKCVCFVYGCSAEKRHDEPGERGGICRCFYGRARLHPGASVSVFWGGAAPLSFALFACLCFRISSSRGLYPRQRI